MKHLLTLLAILLAGCATHRPASPISTLKQARAIQSASVSVAKQEAHVTKARTRIQSAAPALALLDKTATPQQRQSVEVVKVAFRQMDDDLALSQEETRIITGTLVQAELERGLFQAEADNMTLRAEVAEAKIPALEKERDEAVAARRWLVFWNACAVAGMAALACHAFLPLLFPGRWWIVAGAGASAFTATLLIL